MAMLINAIFAYYFQVADVTGRNPDDVSVALHDCNFDTEQTINSLLEGRFDQVSFVKADFFCKTSSVKVEPVVTCFVLFQGEWKVTSSRKKKPQTTTTSQGIDSIITNTAPPIAPKSGSRPPRGGGKSSGMVYTPNKENTTSCSCHTFMCPVIILISFSSALFLVQLNSYRIVLKCKVCNRCGVVLCAYRYGDPLFMPAPRISTLLKAA